MDGTVRINEVVGVVRNALSAPLQVEQRVFSTFEVLPEGYLVQESPTGFVVRRAVVDFTLANLETVAKLARFVPHFVGGMPVGYRMFDMLPGSLLEQLGFIDGDIVMSVNDMPVVSEEFDLGAQLSADEVMVALVRSRVDMNLVYTVDP